jgi:glutathione S-transferase
MTMLKKGMADYNAQIGDKEFIALDQPTLADFVLAYILMGSQAKLLPLDVSTEAPNL